MTLFGYVQAGGGSMRFGRDKALAKFGGKTMLARTTELLAAVCRETRIVAPAGKYSDLPATGVNDRWPGEGPMGGILTALLDAQERSAAPVWNLIVSCDMPFLTREFLQFLGEHAEQSAAQVVVPQTNNGLEPLCACWNSAATPAIQELFDAGARRVSHVMKQLPLEVLDEPLWKRFDTDGRLFWNMNTPADYEEAHRVLDARQP